MKYVIASIVFLVVAGLTTQPSANGTKGKSFHILLNKEKKTLINIHQPEIGGPYFLALENIPSFEKLHQLEKLEFNLPSKNCSLIKKKESAFYCASPHRGFLATQSLKGKEVHLMSFSSYPFKGRVFNNESGEMAEQIIYKTSFVLKKGSQSFIFDFHTSGEKSQVNRQVSHYFKPIINPQNF